MNIFRYFVEITIFNHLKCFSQLIHSYFTAKIWFSRMYMYGFELHVWKIGWMYLVTFFFIVFRWSFRWKNIQSHTYPPPSSRYSANNAVDRNTDTCTKTWAIGYRPQFHVVFWVVDLERVHNIYSSDILFKNGDGMYTYNPRNILLVTELLFFD